MIAGSILPHHLSDEAMLPTLSVYVDIASLYELEQFDEYHVPVFDCKSIISAKLWL